MVVGLVVGFWLRKLLVNIGRRKKEEGSGSGGQVSLVWNGNVKLQIRIEEVVTSPSSSSSYSLWHSIKMKYKCT